MATKKYGMGGLSNGMAKTSPKKKPILVVGGAAKPPMTPKKPLPKEMPMPMPPFKKSPKKGK